MKVVALGDGTEAAMLAAGMPVATAVTTPAATATSAVTSMRCRSADQNQNQNSEFPKQGST